ncbi:hypothetical protein FTUN_4269 [Frigoriglobus tundricola]|uniref:Uncharacterized protein n=1 Tax=Frigoriglobus tundricola TaxID=2774151 RepID=A0A6M5YTL0_9BACT|nr:hypothetical protein FTUN_4269 [Frigoriglobus tundricola]
MARGTAGYDKGYGPFAFAATGNGQIFGAGTQHPCHFGGGNTARKNVPNWPGVLD